MEFSRQDLSDLQPKHISFVGIDSDGCIFDTMEIKQKKCFHKLIISHWGLQPLEKYVRQTAEFINLYSKYRGTNRFPCLAMTFDLLRERPEVIASGISIPQLPALKKFIASGQPLGNPSLEKAVLETGDAELAFVLKWSKAVNADIAQTVTNVPPYRWVLESLLKIQENSDPICVTHTPSEALIRKWQQHDLLQYVQVIAGQELGTKTEHLQLATGGRYAPADILMIGDAPGDLAAARAIHAHFYPINPGQEVQSWERFYHEAYAMFLAHTYGGDYEAARIADFEKLLPEQPPWQSNPVQSA
ncbi:MAG: HAD family hydrolase [Lentisphaerae bacterium]|nr:HAD family hydrolase [Lentisphaerota bacterium]